MNPIFLSYFLEESTPTYGGTEGTIIIERIRAISAGDTSNNLNLSFPNHVCTHIDFPYHFDDNGKTINDYPASFWLFNKIGFLKCAVEEIPVKIMELPKDIEILILKTGFGKNRGEKEYWDAQPVIPAAYAVLLRKRFISLRVFGFDFISLTSKLDRVEGRNAHLEFLKANEILLLEDMNLEKLFDTPSNIVLLPLLVAFADGSPCAVIAF